MSMVKDQMLRAQGQRQEAIKIALDAGERRMAIFTELCYRGVSVL
jgi:hypothetical protein